MNQINKKNDQQKIKSADRLLFTFALIPDHF